MILNLEHRFLQLKYSVIPHLLQDVCQTSSNFCTGPEDEKERVGGKEKIQVGVVE